MPKGIDPRYITQSEASRQLGFSRQYFTELKKSQNRPTWLVQVQGRWLIDSQDESYQAQVMLHDIPAEDEPGDDIDDMKEKLRTLKYGSIKANLEIPIQKAELNRYKIEQERLSLEKDAGKLIEFDLCQYLFTGYLDRLNRETLDIAKRLSKQLEMQIQEGLHAKTPAEQTAKKVIKLITREMEASIREVKSSQKKEVEAWKAEK